MARDHGGNLTDARARFGGEAAEWLDLSTGINPVAYPVGGLAPAVWAKLPDRSAFDAAAAQERLAGARIWSRIFPYSPHWLRLGLPGDEASWQRLDVALGE